MKPRFRFLGFLVGGIALAAGFALADGVPEPGLTLYGGVYNTSLSNARITSGMVECVVTPSAGGAPVTFTAPLQDLGGGYCYRLRISFETLVGSTTLSEGALPATLANTSYQRSVTVIINGNRLTPATQPVPFQFKSADHAKVEELNLYVQAGSGPQSVPHFSDRDDDGISDADEVKAGTNPDDPNDNLRFTRLTRFVGQGILLEWTSSAGREYTLHRSDGGLGRDDFRLLQDGLLATPRVNGFLDRTATNAGPYFYRVSVR